MKIFYNYQKWFLSLAVAVSSLAFMTLAVAPSPVVATDTLKNFNDAVTLTNDFSTKAGYTTATVPAPETVIGKIIGYTLSFLGVVFFVLIVYAGWQWLTAAGEEEKITKAKSLIINSVIGLIIVFSAYLISAFVVGKVAESIV
ncbi:MAG: hypothetical protein WCT37_03535 [Patescibacteria group bacterium]|jgi:hypothetical protein